MIIPATNIMLIITISTCPWDPWTGQRYLQFIFYLVLLSMVAKLATCVLSLSVVPLQAGHGLFMFTVFAPGIQITGFLQVFCSNQPRNYFKLRQLPNNSTLSIRISEMHHNALTINIFGWMTDWVFRLDARYFKLRYSAVPIKFSLFSLANAS